MATLHTMHARCKVVNNAREVYFPTKWIQSNDANVDGSFYNEYKVDHGLSNEL